MFKARFVTVALAGIGVLTCAAVVAQQPAANLTPSSFQGDPYGVTTYRSGQGGTYQSETHTLAQQYAKATKAEDKQEIRKKLSEALVKQFDANVEHQQKELVDLEKQIADLRALLKRRQDAKSTIVERRLEQIIQEAEGLGWTAPGTAAPRGMMGGFSRPATIPAPVANPPRSSEAAR